MLAALPRALSQRLYMNKAVGIVSTVYHPVVMFSTTFIMIADDEVTKNINFVRRHGNRRLKSKNTNIYRLRIIFRQPNSPAMFAVHYGDHFLSCPSVSAYMTVCSESHVIIVQSATPAIVRRYNGMPHDRHPHSR